MGICRNSKGILSYTAVNSDGDVFSVEKGDNRILYHRPYITGIANYMIDSQMAFWEECPKFQSFVKAVHFMKNNLENLF